MLLLNSVLITLIVNTRPSIRLYNTYIEGGKDHKIPPYIVSGIENRGGQFCGRTTAYAICPGASGVKEKRKFSMFQLKYVIWRNKISSCINYSVVQMCLTISRQVYCGRMRHGRARFRRKPHTKPQLLNMCQLAIFSRPKQLSIIILNFSIVQFCNNSDSWNIFLGVHTSYTRLAKTGSVAEPQFLQASLLVTIVSSVF